MMLAPGKKLLIWNAAVNAAPQSAPIVDEIHRFLSKIAFEWSVLRGKKWPLPRSPPLFSVPHGRPNFPSFVNGVRSRQHSGVEEILKLPAPCETQGVFCDFVVSCSTESFFFAADRSEEPSYGRTFRKFGGRGANKRLLIMMSRQARRDENCGWSPLLDG